MAPHAMRCVSQSSWRSVSLTQPALWSRRRSTVLLLHRTPRKLHIRLHGLRAWKRHAEHGRVDRRQSGLPVTVHCTCPGLLLLTGWWWSRHHLRPRHVRRRWVEKIEFRHSWNNQTARCTLKDTAGTTKPHSLHSKTQLEQPNSTLYTQRHSWNNQTALCTLKDTAGTTKQHSVHSKTQLEQPNSTLYTQRHSWNNQTSLSTLKDTAGTTKQHSTLYTQPIVIASNNMKQNKNSKHNNKLCCQTQQTLSLFTRWRHSPVGLLCGIFVPATWTLVHLVTL